MCEIPTASSNKKKKIILLTLLTLIQRKHISSVRVGLANGTQRTPSQNWGNLLSELHVSHEQCLISISDAFSAFFFFFTGIRPSLSRALLYPRQKRAYSALRSQALTECSPLEFRRSSVTVLVLEIRNSSTITKT